MAPTPNHRLRKTLIAVLIATLGWTISIGFGTLVDTPLGLHFFDRIGWYTGWSIVHNLTPWPIGGLVTGLALALTAREVRWHHALLLALGWTVTAPLTWGIGLPAASFSRLLTTSGAFTGPLGLPFIIPATTLRRLPSLYLALDGPLAVPMGLLLCGAITALLLRAAADGSPSSRAVRWPYALGVAAAWAIAYQVAIGTQHDFFTLPNAPNWTLYFPTIQFSLPVIAGGALHGAAFGLIGGGGMFALLALGGWGDASLPARRRAARGLRSPLLARLLRTSRGPGVRASLAIFAGSLVLGVALVAGLWWAMPAAPAPLAILSLLGMAALVAAPLLVAAASAGLTADVTGDPGFGLLRLTALTEREIMSSIVAAALYRVRWVLCGLAVLTPLFVGGRIHTYGLQVAPVMTRQLVWPGAALAAVSLAMWGLALFGAVIGAALALIVRRISALAMALAPVLVLAVSVPLITTVLAGTSGRSQTAWVSEGVGIVCCMLLPYVLSGELLRAARRWVWPRERVFESFLPAEG